MDDIITEFVAETQEGLNELDTSLLSFEKNPQDRQLLDKIFRTLHTIKGTCGFLGLARLEKVAHTAETLLDSFRHGNRTASSEEVVLILCSIDRIRLLIEAIAANGAEPEGEDSDILILIEAAIAGGGNNQNNDAATSRDQPAEEPAAAAQGAEQPPPATATGGGNAAGDPATQFLRVNVDTLEKMLNMVSELVLTRNQLAQIIRQHHDATLSAPLQRLNSVVLDLQDSVMKTRMQPIGNAWVKFPRIVHDVARELNKKIRLEMSGEEAEVDRQVLEMIKDPLMHMVRNSADHGIETPDVRLAAGKPETGTISLSARHEGGYIIIEIRDDGKGISPARIRETALRKGLATAEHLASLSDRQVLSYIFAAGFSTAEKVTSVSGRGVGMDVVRTNIEKIGGTIELESEEGRGSLFTIQIPLTLAIISALLVENARQQYAFPQLTVQELVRIEPDSPEQIEMIGNRPVLRFREQVLPLIPLTALLGDKDTARAANNPHDCYIVVSTLGASMFGMMVDKVLGTEEIVVKPVSSILKSIPFFAGNTILGDGRVIMILDPPNIAKSAGIAPVQDAQNAPLSTAQQQMRDASPLLLFRAGNDEPKAVPAFLVSRIEEIGRERLEHSGNSVLMQYQGRLIRMHSIGAIPDGAVIKTLIFSDDMSENAFGIMVDDIADIVDTDLVIKSGTRRPGFLGTSIVAGRATAILDVNYFTGEKDWLSGEDNAPSSARHSVLIVDDSAFFRHMLQPLLSMAGYAVTMAEGPLSALKLCDAGENFDLIISDIEMEEMNGLAFAEKIRRDTRWKNTPMVALSSHATPQDIANGYAKGFTAYVAKSDRDALLSTIHDVLQRQAHERIEA